MDSYRNSEELVQPIVFSINGDDNNRNCGTRRTPKESSSTTEDGLHSVCGTFSVNSSVSGEDFDVPPPLTTNKNSEMLEASIPSIDGPMRKRKRQWEEGGESKLECDFSTDSLSIAGSKRDTPEERTELIDGSGYRQDSSASTRNVLVNGYECRKIDNETIAVTIHAQRGCTKQANWLDRLRRKVVQAIEESVPGVAVTAQIPGSPDQKDTVDDNSNIPTDPTGRDADDRGTETGRQPGSSSIVQVQYSGQTSGLHIDCSSGGAIRQEETNLLPASTRLLRMNTKYMMLQELLMSDERERQPRKEFGPLTGERHSDMTDDDFYKLVHHMLTRTIKKHCRLNAFKNTSTTDQIALIKKRIRTASMVQVAIMHNWRNGTVHIDYPGRPHVADDFSKRFPGGTHQRMYKFGLSYPEEFRGDNTLALILCALAVFDFEFGVSKILLSSRSRSDLREISNMYSELLKEHLSSTYGEREALLGYRILTTWLNCMCIFSDTFKHASTFELEPWTFNIVELHIPFLENSVCSMPQ